MADKTFINGVFIREHQFPDGGSVLNVSIPTDKLESLLGTLREVQRDGWVKLVISKNRQPTINRTSGKVIATHSLTVDTWQPKQQTSPRPANAQQSGKAETTEEGDQVPF